MLFDVLKRSETKVKKLEDIVEFLSENQCYIQLSKIQKGLQLLL